MISIKTFIFLPLGIKKIRKIKNNMSHNEIFNFLSLDDFHWNLYSLYRCAISENKPHDFKDRLSEEILHEFLIRTAVDIIIDEDDWENNIYN